MTTRAADATIKGYYYQFDTSILKLLDLPTDSDSVIIEGIEDIDINTATDTTTVQCKYLSKPRFINSAVRDPITLMLDHFVNPATPNNLKYILYAHFESESPGSEPTIDLTKLKEILTYIGLTRLNGDKSASAYRKLVKMEYMMQKTPTDIENRVSNA